MALSSRKVDLVYAELEGLKTWINGSWVVREANRRPFGGVSSLEITRLAGQIEERIGNIQKELRK